VYQAGTLSGNPVALAAGLAALEELAATDAYAKLEALGATLEAGLREAAKAAGVPVWFNRCGSMFCTYFTNQPVWNLADAMTSDRERFSRYFHGLLERGIYVAPSQFEAGFLSTAHTLADVELTVNVAAQALREV
jgi:glutamate-1-semialdehyde 2,1-aminomutase